MERYPHKELLQDVPVETLQDFGTIQLARLKSLAASVPGWRRWPLTNLKALHLSEIANVEKKLTPAILVQAKNGPKRRCFPLRHGATFQRNIFVASPTARISGGADVVLRS